MFESIYRALILVLLVSSSANAFSRRVSVPVPAPSESPLPAFTPAPPVPVDPIGRVTFEPVQYYSTPVERQKIAAAADRVHATIHSSCFVQWMSNRKLIQTNGRSSAEVAAHIQSLSGILPVEMYSRCIGAWPCTSAVAYRNVGDATIHLNRNAFSRDLPACQWAKTLAHEGDGHVLGEYGHDFKWNAARSFSVPYSLGGADRSQGGDVFDACCREVEEEQVHVDDHPMRVFPVAHRFLTTGRCMDHGHWIKGCR